MSVKSHRCAKRTEKCKFHIELLTKKRQSDTINIYYNYKLNLSKKHLKMYKMYKKFFKRIFDITLAALGLVIVGPLFALLAILIKLDSKGPVIFKQQRLGKNGKIFNIYKFRSMCVGAEKIGSGVYSGKGDARVTKVGKFLRASSMDELPQLINILIGDMSFIGPRPPLTYHP